MFKLIKSGNCRVLIQRQDWRILVFIHTDRKLKNHGCVSVNPSSKETGVYKNQLKTWRSMKLDT